MNYTLPEDKVLVLRSCKPDMTSKNGFLWPTSGPVSAPDWEDNTECGRGLHGWLWGVGDFDLKYKEVGAKWLAVEVSANDIRDIDKKKVKFPKGEVIVAGSFREAYDLVKKWFWLRHASAAGTSGHASAAGDYGHASAAGTSGHASAAGDYGHASAAGNYGHASAAGTSGHASAAGDYGHASAAGKYGVACVFGQEGKAKCGEDGSIILTYWDGKRLRHVVGYDGENGIVRGQWYMLDSNNQFVPTASDR